MAVFVVLYLFIVEKNTLSFYYNFENKSLHCITYYFM